MTFAKLKWLLVNVIGWIPVPVWERDPKRSEVFQ